MGWRRLSHSLAVLDDGKVYSWGRNDYGQLGDGKFVEVLIPSIITMSDKTILLSAFGKGGRAVGFTELEKKFERCWRTNKALKKEIGKSLIQAK